MDDIRAKIRNYVMEDAAPQGITQVSDSEPLVEKGIIDSVGIFRLVAFLEENFGIRISDKDIVPDNFSTIAEIQDFVNEKLASKRAKASPA